MPLPAQPTLPPQAMQFPPQATQFPPQATQFPPQATQFPPQATQFPPQATQFPPQAFLPDFNAQPSILRAPLVQSPFQLHYNFEEFINTPAFLEFTTFEQSIINAENQRLAEFLDSLNDGGHEDDTIQSPRHLNQPPQRQTANGVTLNVEDGRSIDLAKPIFSLRDHSTEARFARAQW
jgi:hypothetical protein